MTAIHVDWNMRNGHRPPPSMLHGFFVKLRGTLSGNRRQRRRGEREMQDASALREYQREKAARRRAASGGSGFSLFGTGSSSGSGRYHHHRRPRNRDRGPGAVYVQDHAYKRHPWLHFPYRCKPWYHGHQHRFIGYITQRHERSLKGRMMNEEAASERRKERKRRQRQMRREGLAIRVGHAVRKAEWAP